MKHFKRTFLMGTVFLVVALVAAACGNGSGSSGSSGSSSSSSGGSYGYGGGGKTTPTTAPSASSGTGATIKTAAATVKGKSVTLLTDAQGKTLYYFTADTPTTSACTGGCAQTWPPLLTTGSASPTSATTLSGKLTMQTTGNGSQIEYNGHLLYTYSGDTAPGQTNGEGLFGKWFVATTDLATGNGGSNSNSGSSSGYGY